MKLLDILKFAEEYLSKYSFSKPRLEAETIISYVLKLDRLGLYTNFELELSDEEKESIKKYLREMARKRKSFKELEKNEEKDFKTENLSLLEKTKIYLKGKGVQDYKLDAEEIFSHVLGCKRSFLNLQLSKEIGENSLEKIRKMVVLRGKARKPIQQILGEWEFYGYPFKIDENVLIPRADTEILVEQCKFLMLEKQNPIILDIGTGSGAIGITLAKELPNSKVIALDISEQALKIALENAKLNKVENIEFRKSDVFSSVTETFDLIVSNPPYIPIEEYNELQTEVRKYEPRLALTDNGDGYFFYEKISKEAGAYLKVGGYLAFEVGYNQSEKVAELMEKNKITPLKIVQDYCGKNRVVIGVKEEREKSVN